MSRIQLYRYYINPSIGEILTGEEWAEVSARRVENGLPPVTSADLVDYEEWRETQRSYLSPREDVL